MQRTVQAHLSLLAHAHVFAPVSGLRAPVVRMEFIVSTGLLLTLVCGLGWVISDALRKRLANDADPLSLAVWLAGGQLLLLIIVCPVLLWVGGLGTWSEWRLASSYWWYAVPTFMCTAVGHVFFLKSLRVSDLGLTIPYLSFSPIFVMVCAVLFLDEYPTFLALVGVCTVALGAFALNRPQSSSPGAQEMHSGARKGAVFMLITAVCWSAAAALDKGALNHSSALTHLVLLLLSTVMLLEFFRRVWPSDSVAKGAVVEWAPLILVCCVMTGALALQLTAYTYWDVAYVEAVKRAMGLLGSVLVGALMFHEKGGRKRLSAVVVMAIGTGLIILFEAPPV